MDVLLVVNAGSSSIKFAVYEPQARAGATPARIAHGQVAQVGARLQRHVVLNEPGAAPEIDDDDEALPGGAFDATAAMARMFDWLDAHRGGLRVVAVGHRVVHGGADLTAPARVTPALLQQLQALTPLAPLHQPHNLQAIALARQRWPAVPQVVCCDTAFHATQPAVAQALALPRTGATAGLRRYGFHGLSYEHIATRLADVLGPVGRGRVIAAHLGNGASLCAMQDGRSVATTMGFSVLDGLVMGSRCGSIDPGVLLYLLQARGLTPQALSDLLYRASGLLGVSGISSDMQALLDSAAPAAAEAVDLFVYRAVGAIGTMAAALGGVDAIVFSAGMGEHAPEIRARIAAGCAWLGARLDAAANAAGGPLIHAADSRLALAVVPTDEEGTIARHTLAVLKG
jgi:acetate kinase